MKSGKRISSFVDVLRPSSPLFTGYKRLDYSTEKFTKSPTGSNYGVFCFDTYDRAYNTAAGVLSPHGSWQVAEIWEVDTKGDCHLYTAGIPTYSEVRLATKRITLQKKDMFSRPNGVL
jgi:hypothetical protein